MRYYLLKQDGVKLPMVEKSDTDLLEVKGNQSDYYPDFLEEPLLLVSSEGKNIIKKYCIDTKFELKTVCDFENNIQNSYFAITLLNIDGFSDATSYMKDNITIDRMVLDKAKIANRKIFKIDYFKKEYVFVSLDLAESILRRSLTGFSFLEVEVN